MFKASQQKLGVRILLGVVVAMLGVGMLLYLIPGQGTSDVQSADVVAQVADQPITITDIQTQLTRIAQSSSIPPALQPLYVQQVLRNIIFEKELEYEAKELGIGVTDQERAARIRQLIPTAFVGNSFVGSDAYAQQVQERTGGLSVEEFEQEIGQSLLEEKFREMITDGIKVTPEQIEQEFRRRNDKIKIDYVVIKPEDLEPKINPSDADLQTYFEQNKARYSVPEKRILDYAFLNLDTLRNNEKISDEDVQAYYKQNLDRYKMEDRVKVAHILFKTVDKTDSETAEIQQKADDVDKKAKSGGNFADLAKQYSDDTTKDKGGELDWLVHGQTVPEFDKVAFSLPKGGISDVVKTPYGFEIIKVLDREMARTQSLDEVRSQIVTTLQQAKAQTDADMISGQISDEIRRSGRVSLDDLGKKYSLMTGETQPLEVGAPIPEVGDAPEMADTVSHLRVGDDSPPIRTDKGYVVLSLKSIEPAHPATLAEVRDKVLLDYRRDKAGELAKADAADLAKKAQQSGQDLDKAAKAAGFTIETSDLVARGGSIMDIGNVSQMQDAFKMMVGQTGNPIFLGANWAVYSLVQHQEPDMSQLAAQTDDISKQLLNDNREVAFEAFRDALDARMRQQGKLTINADALKRLNNTSGSTPASPFGS